MLALYKTRFQIQPNETLDLAGSARECLRFLETWVRTSCEKDSLPFSGLQPVEYLERSSDEPQLRSVYLRCGAFFHSFFWRKRVRKGADGWVTLVDLVSDGKELDFQFQLGVEVAAIDLGRDKPTTGLPRLIPQLLTHPDFRCRSGGQAISTLSKTIGFADIEDFCSDVLFNAERELPAIVLTPGDRGRRVPVDPKALAGRLGGVATVHRVRDNLGRHVLDQYLGKSLAVGPDAIRVFAPGLNKESGLEGHWHFLGETIRAKKLSLVGFSSFLFSRLADRSQARFSESPLVPIFRQLATIERASELDAARSQVKEREFEKEWVPMLERQNAQLENEKRELEESLKRRSEEIERLKVELEAARENILELSQKLGRPEVELAEVPPPKTAPRTVHEVVLQAIEESPDLLFLESAKESASETPPNYEFPDRVVDALKRLQEGARERRENGRMEGGWRRYFKQHGLLYKRLSDTTKARWPKEYEFPYDERRELFEEHFTIGAKSANTCLSIHFSTELQTDKIVVAHVGRHLRNTLS